MATIGNLALTYADWAKRMDEGYKVAAIIELLSQTNEILDDILVMEGNLPTGHKTTVRTGLPQATREAHTERQIQDSAARDFYRERFLADFRRAPPTFFVDGIVPENFAFNDRRVHGFERWPELARIIGLDYFVLESVEGYRIYRRIDRKG